MMNKTCFSSKLSESLSFSQYTDIELSYLRLFKGTPNVEIISLLGTVLLMSRSQKVGQGHSIKIANRSFAYVAKFKYLGTTLTDQNHMHEEIKSRLNSGNACCHSVQSLLSSRLLSRQLKVKIYKTIILPVVLYGCETWSLTLREEHRQGVEENIWTYEG
jgi:hypothetical protein